MHTQNSSRELLTIEQFLTLSAKINYQLSARSLNKPALLALVLGPADFDDRERQVLEAAFTTLQKGYRQDRRRLGTPGILHPLRATAILARSTAHPSLLHMLGALLHDKDEDLIEEELGPERWKELSAEYAVLLSMLEREQREQLQRRVAVLSNRGCDTYLDYLVRLLETAPSMPDILHVKLADRIDNTFDINLQHPGVTNYNFYRAVFDILFLPNFRGVEMGRFHFMPEVSEGVMLLSQLFKDTIFLALLRSSRLDRIDATTRKLFVGLAVAGIREAQWLALEMFNTCYADVQKQRALLTEVMHYCSSGGVQSVTSKDAGDVLDGIMVEVFTAQQNGKQKKMLAELFENHELLAKMVLAFIVIFASFINDPDYTIHGIDRLGIRPVLP